ncbi:MAG: resolvase [Armatimonadota bacterium]
MNILAIDPGKNKCGIAVLDNDLNIKERTTAETGNILTVLEKLINEFKIRLIILGGATYSEEIKKIITEKFPEIDLKKADEKHSTEKARHLYFKCNPPKGIWRFIPLGLQTPKEPYDDYAAAVIAIEYIKNKGLE